MNRPTTAADTNTSTGEDLRHEWVCHNNNRHQSLQQAPGIHSTRASRRLPAPGERWLIPSLTAIILCATSVVATAAEVAPSLPPVSVDLRQLILDGGAIGYTIIGLSLFMTALIIEHALTIRRGVLMPSGLAEEVHRLLKQGQFQQAREACQRRPSFLGQMLSAGLLETELGYHAVEKAMEDAAAQQAARLMRKIDGLSLISALAPMLGLMGTVWGMILAFMEFERKANPQVSELAPGVYKALVTTLFGLIVAVPAIAAFAYFRNRIDELVAQTALMAEHVFSDFKRAIVTQRRVERANKTPGRKEGDA